MIDQTTLSILQLLMLVTDGMSIVASFMITLYYRADSRGSAVRLLYYFFAVLTLVFLALTSSDALVIAQAPKSWATLPIVRGLVFRVPIAGIELIMLYLLHRR